MQADVRRYGGRLGAELRWSRLAIGAVAVISSGGATVATKSRRDVGVEAVPYLHTSVQEADAAGNDED